MLGKPPNVSLYVVNTCYGLAHSGKLLVTRTNAESRGGMGLFWLVLTVVQTCTPMANTYTQIHIQVVFAVKFRYGLISDHWKDNLYKYITGIVQNQQHKLLAINGMPDHLHILMGVRPVQSISDLMQDIKGSSSRWINDNKFVKGRFEWQEGYGAFLTVSLSCIL